MTDPKQRLRYPEVVAEGLDDWRFFLLKLHARFKTGSFAKGLELVTRITEAAEEANHHPDVVLTYPQVDVDLRVVSTTSGWWLAASAASVMRVTSSSPLTKLPVANRACRRMRKKRQSSRPCSAWTWE